MSLKPSIHLIVLLCMIVSLIAKNLKVKVTKTRLPTARNKLPGVYDGDDSVYLLGGFSRNWQNDYSDYTTDILKYSITNQTIEMFGQLPRIRSGDALWIGNETIIYSGGSGLWSTDYPPRSIWSYNVSSASSSHTWNVLKDLSRESSYHSTVWDQGEYLYLISCDYGNKNSNGIISRFSLLTKHFQDVAHLPWKTCWASSVWDNNTDSIYIFGGYDGSKETNGVLKFDSKSGTVTKLNTSLPWKGFEKTCTVWTGKEAYIIGTYDNRRPPFVRFDPSTNQATVVQLDYYPSGLQDSACVFVEKLNRIYIFGGFSGTGGGYSDKILYIDLDPSDPPVTSTDLGLNDQNPKVELIKANLPKPLFSFPAVYDGKDSVYLLGGICVMKNNYEFTKDIVKYSIKNETFEIIANNLPSLIAKNAFWIGNGTLAYFGPGYFGPPRIWSYQTAQNAWNNLTDLPKIKGNFHSMVWDQGDHIYFFYEDDYSNAEISRYSLVTNTFQRLASHLGRAFKGSSVWDNSTSSFYIIDGYESYGGSYKNGGLKYDSITGNVTKLNLNLPEATDATTCTVWTGKEAYVIGTSGDRPPLVRFNPITNNATVIQINNFPEVLYDFGCVFVKKLNRIYIFGGLSHEYGFPNDANGYSDKVRFIDLANISTDTDSPLKNTDTAFNSTSTSTTPLILVFFSLTVVFIAVIEFYK